MKVCLVCSPGGHLEEALPIINNYHYDNFFLITYNEPFIKLNYPIKIYTLNNDIISSVDKSFILKIYAMITHFISITIAEISIFLNEKPEIIISTGSEIAIPIFFLSKFFGKKTIYIESLTRIVDISITGKLLYFISDFFYIRWPSLIKKYSRAKCIKNVFLSNTIKRSELIYRNGIILVLVGTAPFPRLVKLMDELSKNIKDEVFIQIGRTNYLPKHAKFCNFIMHDELIGYIHRSKIIVCHAGVGTLFNVLGENIPIYVVPRQLKYHEINDNHQMDLCNILKEKQIANVILNLADLFSLIG